MNIWDREYPVLASFATLTRSKPRSTNTTAAPQPLDKPPGMARIVVVAAVVGMVLVPSADVAY